MFFDFFLMRFLSLILHMIILSSFFLNLTYLFLFRLLMPLRPGFFIIFFDWLFAPLILVLVFLIFRDVLPNTFF